MKAACRSCQRSFTRRLPASLGNQEARRGLRTCATRATKPGHQGPLTAIVATSFLASPLPGLAAANDAAASGGVGDLLQVCLPLETVPQEHCTALRLSSGNHPGYAYVLIRKASCSQLTNALSLLFDGVTAVRSHDHTSWAPASLPARSRLRTRHCLQQSSHQHTRS